MASAVGGAVLVHLKKRREVSRRFRTPTNNRMEIFAAVAGLELLKQPCKGTLCSDSEYLVNAMTKGLGGVVETEAVVAQQNGSGCTIPHQ